jgi:hypothetical protein
MVGQLVSRESLLSQELPFGEWCQVSWLIVFTSGGIANNLMFLELAHKRQTAMTKLSKLHQTGLKNPDYKEAYAATQIEFEKEGLRLSLISAVKKSKRPIQLHDSQIQTRCCTDPK